MKTYTSSSRGLLLLLAIAASACQSAGAQRAWRFSVDAIDAICVAHRIVRPAGDLIFDPATGHATAAPGTGGGAGGPAPSPKRCGR